MHTCCVVVQNEIVAKMVLTLFDSQLRFFFNPDHEI